MSFAELVLFRTEVDSTMAEAAELARDGACHGTTVVAEAQRHGRGRRGRRWLSPRGAGLWMTTILRPPIDLPWLAERLRPAAAAALPSLGIVVGVALARALETLGARGFLLKWPNDLMVGDRKLAGILLEADPQAPAEPFVLAGVGLNLQPLEQACAWLPADLVPRYVGLADVGRVRGASLDASEVRTAVLRDLESCYTTWLRDGFDSLRHDWARFDALRDQGIRAQGDHGLIEGVAAGIGPLGELRVRTAEGVRSVIAGEVQRVHVHNP